MKDIIKKSITAAVIVAMALIFAMPVQTQAAGKARLNKSKVTLYTSGRNKTVTLKVTGTEKKVKWTTSNKKVATVSKNGKVTAKKEGTAVIKAKFGKKTLKCKVTVKKRTVTTQNQSKVTVKFNAKGGKIIAGKSSFSIQKNKAVKQLPIPLKSGYIFKGWYNGGTKVTIDTTFDSNTTVTAKWTATKASHLNTYIYIDYLYTVYYDELYKAPSSEGNEALYQDSDESIAKYMRNTGINKGWRGSGAFDPDYFISYMLKTYGVTFDSYKDAWEVAIGDLESGYYMLETKGNCKHMDNGTHDCKKTATRMDFVSAVVDKKEVAYLQCACEEIFTGAGWDEHSINAWMDNILGHASWSEYPIYETTVIKPARIDYVRTTYCTNTQKELGSKIVKTEPWITQGSGMPGSSCIPPLNHDWKTIDKGLDGEYIVCSKCNKRK